MTPTQPSAASATGGSGSNHHHKRTKLSTAGLTPDPNDGRTQAKDLGRVAMPVYYPRLIVSGANYCFSATGNCNEYPNPASEYNGSYPRAYHLHGRGGGIYPAYRMTLVVNSALGEYYGIQGTTWQHPPILGTPTEVRTVAGKTLALYHNGAHVSLVAWRTPAGVYWISNTLTDSIGNGQMLAMAASLTQAR
jgi:hypothetical protein